MINIIFIKIRFLTYRIYLYIKYFILIIILFPFSFIIYLYRKEFSINPITSERIGHFAADLDLAYIKKVKATCQYRFNIWFLQDYVANKELKKMWEQVITFTPRFIAFPVYYTLTKIFRAKIHKYIDLPGENFDYSELNQAGITIKINQKLNSNDGSVTSYFKLHDVMDYICLAIRDDEYLKNIFPIYNWDHHELRNCNIDRIVSSIEVFTNRNIAAIRMGRFAKKLENSNKLIFDYANSKINNEVNDLLLFSNCKFVISSGTGMEDLGTLFRKNIYLVNFTSFIGMRNLDLYKICLPKNFKWIKTGQYLTWQDILDFDVFKYKYRKELFKLGIECEDNTDAQLQKYFEEIYESEFININNERTEFDEEFSNYIKRLNKQTGITTKISKNWRNYKFI